MKSFVLPLCVALLFLFACNNHPQNSIDINEDSSLLLKAGGGRETDSSQLNLIGVYEGVVPCADCKGIKTELTLYQDIANSENNTYILKETYLTDKTGDTTFTSNGKWDILKGIKTDNNATVYFLNYEDPDEARYFLKLGADSVALLDKEQQRIHSTGNYTLTKR